MSRILYMLSVAIFSVFLGSQVTEGVLLIPYWRSLSELEFYAYYTVFGPTINSFYTFLTITAVLVPICHSVYDYYKRNSAIKYSLISTVFALLVIVVYYIYFKGVNQQFFDAVLSDSQLKKELLIWRNWHWVRVVFETLSLLFLIMAFKVSSQRFSG